MRERTAVDRALPGRPIAADRDRDDFHRTPEWATEALLRRETFSHAVWEPACGDGAIARVVEMAGYRVHASDLIDRGYGTTGIDFLTVTAAPSVAANLSMITNPPYHQRMPERFLHHALSLGVDKVAMLLRLLWLEGDGRSRTVFRGTTPLKTVYVFSTRVDVARSDFIHRSTGHGGTVAFAWYVWERGHAGRPTLDWI